MALDLLDNSDHASGDRPLSLSDIRGLEYFNSGMVQFKKVLLYWHVQKKTKCHSLKYSRYKPGSTPNFGNPTLSVNHWKQRGKLHQVNQTYLEMSFSLLLWDF